MHRSIGVVLQPMTDGRMLGCLGVMFVIGLVLCVWGAVRRTSRVMLANGEIEDPSKGTAPLVLGIVVMGVAVLGGAGLWFLVSLADGLR